MRRSVLALLLAGLVLPASADAYGTAAVRSTMAKAMRYVGGASGAYALDLTTGKAIYSFKLDRPRMPASVEKLYTTSTALLRLGPRARFTTRVVGTGTLTSDGVYHGNLWLVGGGDPTLSSRAVGVLAGRLRSAGIRRVTGRVLGDESLFDHLRGSAETGGRPDPWIIGELSALAVDRGMTSSGGYQRNPPLSAALRLAGSLRRSHVPVPGRTGLGIAPAGARVLASWSSPQLGTLVGMTLRPSDNFYAEMLVKDLGARFGGRPGTTSKGARVVLGTMSRYGILPQVVDGSGLSRSDRTTPRQVVQLLSMMSRSPLASTLRGDMAVPGVSGTLVNRMQGSAAAGRCAAKTGTLSDVSALAGYCPTRNGHTVAFAFLMNSVSITRAHIAQDRMAESLAGSRLP